MIMCTLKNHVFFKHHVGVQVGLRSDDQKAFVALPKRWVVERTFSWFESYRRLSKDYEYLTDTSETMIQLAMIRLMLNRIEK